MKLASQIQTRPPLTSIPRHEDSRRIARELRDQCGEGHRDAVDLRAICASLRVQVRIATLSASAGLQEALLTPLAGDRFGASIDPTPRGGWKRIPNDIQRDLRRHRIRFRLGHELAHTLFYRRSAGATPRRLLFDSPEQESFCDLLSRHLLVPWDRALEVGPRCSDILGLQESCDVSLELAARAVAEARPDIRVSIWLGTDSDELRLQWSSDKDSSHAQLERAIEGGPRTDIAWLTTREQVLALEQA